MTTYGELLKHPLWQQKRLRILERDGFQCSECGAEDRTLHVHHGYYERGKKPWEYEDATLHTLCEDCHEEVQAKLLEIQRHLALVPPDEMAHVLGFLQGVLLGEHPSRAVRIPADTLEEITSGIAAAWGLKVEDVLDVMARRGSRTLLGMDLHRLACQVKNCPLCSECPATHPSA